MTNNPVSPRHYQRYSVECIQLAEEMPFNLGNVLKYVYRCGDKDDPVQELSKARWYLDREIARIEDGR